MIQAHKLIKSVCFRHILVYNISWGVRSKDQCHMKKNHLNSCCVRRNQNACNNSIVTMHQGLVFSKCSILGFKINGSLIIIGTFHGWLTPHYLIVTEWRISRRIFFFERPIIEQALQAQDVYTQFWLMNANYFLFMYM